MIEAENATKALVESIKVCSPLKKKKNAWTNTSVDAKSIPNPQYTDKHTVGA